MPQIVVVRRRHGNAGIVRNIAAGVAGGIAAGWRGLAGGETVTEERVVVATPAAPAPATAPAPPKTFTEAQVDDMLEEIEDMILRRVTDPDLAPDCRKLVTDLLGEYNRTFRGES